MENLLKKIVTHFPYGNILKFVTFTGVLLYCSFRLFELKKIVMYHPDEYDYVYLGIFLQLLLTHDMKNPAWQSYSSSSQPLLPSYLYGAATLAAGNQLFTPEIVYTQSELCDAKHNTGVRCKLIMNNNIFWKSPRLGMQYVIDTDMNSEEKRVFSTILTARTISTLMAIGSLYLIFLIGLQGGFFMGMSSMILLYNNNLFRLSTVRSMGDSPLLLFLLLTVLLSMKYAKPLSEPNRKRTYIYSVFVGVTGGLAMSSKINGIMGILYATALTFWYIAGNMKKSDKLITATTSVLIFAGLTFIVFLLINPFTWESPIQKTIFMYQSRAYATYSLQSILHEWSLPTIRDRLSVVIHQTILPGGAYINFPRVGILNAFTFFSGLLVLFLSWLFRKQKAVFSVQLIILLILFFTLVTGYIGLDWDRYYLPLVFCVVLVQSVFFSFIVETFMYFGTYCFKKVSYKARQQDFYIS